MEEAIKPGAIFEEKIGAVVTWAGGGDIFVLSLSDNTWRRVAPSAKNVVHPGSQDASGGTFGRFQRSERLNVYVLMDLATENVFLYKVDHQLLGQ